MSALTADELKMWHVRSACLTCSTTSKQQVSPDNITLLCGTRSLMAMESRAIAGSLSADHQLPGVPNAKEVLLNKLIHNHRIGPPEK
jgi:hypothetical protein